jgi:hypothetical protein
MRSVSETNLKAEKTSMEFAACLFNLRDKSAKPVSVDVATALSTRTLLGAHIESIRQT